MPKPQTKPFNVYVVDAEDGERGYWTKIGVAFANADGKGYNLKLTALPLFGRLVIREQTDKPEAGQ